MDLYGPVWSFMVLYDLAWICMDLYSPVLSCMAFYGLDKYEPKEEENIEDNPSNEYDPKSQDNPVSTDSSTV